MPQVIDKATYDPTLFRRELSLLEITQVMASAIVNLSENNIIALINGRWAREAEWKLTLANFTANTIGAKCLALGWMRPTALACCKRALQGIEFDERMMTEEMMRYKPLWKDDVLATRSKIERIKHPVFMELPRDGAPRQ